MLGSGVKVRSYGQVLGLSFSEGLSVIEFVLKTVLILC